MMNKLAFAVFAMICLLIFVYFNIDFDHPVKALVSFILMSPGILFSIYFANFKTKTKGND